MYGTVLHRHDRFQMWYATWTRECEPRICYAESDDGVVWRKPELGVCEFGGSKANNIVLDSMNPEGGLIDDISVIADPDDNEWPLKALYWDRAFGPAQTTGIYLARSTDGIHWDRSPGLVLPDWGDRFNAPPRKINGKYLVFGRADNRALTGPAPFVHDKGRVVWRAESDDLRRWSEPELVLAPDIEDTALMQVYSTTAFPYGDLLLGGMERMWVSPDKLDTEIIWSRDDGRSWRRSRPRPSFIPWGAQDSWDGTWINLPTNGPIEQGDRLWFYYSGRSGAHGVSTPHNHGAIGLATLRRDGFASLQARAVQGYVLTVPLLWPDAELSVNVEPRGDTAAHPSHTTGECAVAVRDEANRPLEGYDWDDCVPLARNRVAQTVEWKNGKTLRALAGRRVRLDFRLRECHLYSYRAV
jgi:hypothetical protein